MKKIYLAGPEVFLPAAGEVLARHQQMCREYGFVGLSPFDSVLKQQSLAGLQLAGAIFTGNLGLLDECDLVLANCNYFRGAVVDDGTAFEIGYAFARKKTIFGFIDQKEPLPALVAKKIKLEPHASGYPADSDGYLVNEDFGNSINLMLEFAIEQSGGELFAGDFAHSLKKLAEKFRQS